MINNVSEAVQIKEIRRALVMQWFTPAKWRGGGGVGGGVKGASGWGAHDLCGISVGTVAQKSQEERMGKCASTSFNNTSQV